MTFQQVTEFEWGKMIGLHEGSFSNHAIVAGMEHNSSMSVETVGSRELANSDIW